MVKLIKVKVPGTMNENGNYLLKPDYTYLKHRQRSRQENTFMSNTVIYPGISFMGRRKTRSARFRKLFSNNFSSIKTPNNIKYETISRKYINAN